MRAVKFANETGMVVVDNTSGCPMELSGEELDEYCRNRGICKRCVKVQTHKRVVKLFGHDFKWEPLTIRTDDKKNKIVSSNEEYAVYKGYCLKEKTCYRLGEAKRILGERSDAMTSFHKFSNLRFSVSKNVLKRPGKRRMRTNPETGSLSGSVLSFASNFSELNSTSSHSQLSKLSGMSRMSGLSGFDSFRKNQDKKKHKSKKKKNRFSSSLSLSSFSSKLNDSKSSLDSDITIEELDISARTMPEVGSPPEISSLSPIVQHRCEQLIQLDHFVALTLSKIDLSIATGSANMDTIVQALGTTKTLESITLERCNLDDEGVEKLAGGLEVGGHIHRLENGFTINRKGSLKTLRLRGNRIGNRGVLALEFLFRTSSTLEELDLAENCIGSKGAVSILEALSQNYEHIPLSILNLSQNEIWNLCGRDNGMMDGSKLSFLHTNTTLTELNLDGNCLHDEGVEYIAQALVFNKRNCALQKLSLGYNGIGDNGALALARALESNNSIKVLGLAENDIANTGARALLSALAVNVSIKEISGLYHNKIDRKFIIVAIKRLLHRTIQQEILTAGEVASNEGATSIHDSSLHPVAATEEDEETTNTTSSLSYVEDSSQVVALHSSSTVISTSTNSGSHALEAIKSWDWGTFGIDEVEQSLSEDNGSQIDRVEEEICQDCNFIDHETESAMEINKEERPLSIDRIVVFQAAPLAYFDRKSMQHHAVPLLDFNYEATVLKEIFANTKKIEGGVEVVFETATQKNFNNFLNNPLSPIMHFSSYGNSDCITLENGFGYMQALPFNAMKKLVSMATAQSNLKVVVVSSCHANKLTEVFLSAGVPHVIVLSREMASFRDEGTIAFARVFYKSLLQSKSLREAFDNGISECAKVSSPLSSYKLLPEEADHNVQVFFQNPPPPMIKSAILAEVFRSQDPTAILPKMPDQFFGREVDIYEILESMRVDDVIRIGGAPGCGKKSTLSVLSRYVLDRTKSLQIDSVFWLPAPAEIVPDHNSLYSDLCEVFQLIATAEDNIWDDGRYKEVRRRILIQMERRTSILVIDSRVVTNEIAGEMLEKFLTLLLNEVNVKIIFITASETSRSKRSNITSEVTSTIYLDPLDLQSTAKLYGSACPFIGHGKQNDYIRNIDSVDRFESYLLLQSPVRNTKDSMEQSRRQKELYTFMGEGKPREIIRRATACTSKDMINLLNIAEQPDVVVSTSKELKEQRKRWIIEKDYAIQMKYYKRVRDIETTLKDLKELEKLYPSLDSMKVKEDDLNKKFRALLQAKRYDEANFVKRKILLLKRDMAKEKFFKGNSKKEEALNSISAIQERMKAVMALAESTDSSSAFTKLEEDTRTKWTFVVQERCTLEISCGSLSSFWKESAPTKNSFMIVWTNEACELCESNETMQQALYDAIGEDITFTDWGPIGCATGDSVAVNTGDGCMIFAVPPLSPRNDDAQQDSLQYMETRLSSAICSSFQKIREQIITCTEVTEIVVGISTQENLNQNDEYRKKNLAVTLNTIVSELCDASKVGFPNLKIMVRLFASSGRIESSELIKLASELGITTLST